VNCAGLSYRSPATDFPEDQWNKISQVNVKATFQLSRALAKHWLHTSLSKGPLQTAKNIINVASVLSFTGSFGVAAYTSSKGAIAQLTKSLSN